MKYIDGPREIRCYKCGETFTAEELFQQHENCPMDSGLYMNWAQYLQVLKNLERELVNHGELIYWDSNDIGDKDNECTWGLCTKSRNVYNDPMMHLWPWQYAEEGRHASKYRSPGQHCPMCHDWQRRAHGAEEWEAPTHGCFYSCRLFNPNNEGRPTREQAIKLIHDRICKVKLWMGLGLVE